MLRPEQRQRFARQLLLAEVDEAAQHKLCSSAVRSGDAADPRAAEVALDYLRRAGFEAPREDAPELPGVTATDVDALASDPLLRHAATDLCGALAAIAAIRKALELQGQQPPPPRLDD